MAPSKAQRPEKFPESVRWALQYGFKLQAHRTWVRGKKGGCPGEFCFVLIQERPLKWNKRFLCAWLLTFLLCVWVVVEEGGGWCSGEIHLVPMWMPKNDFEYCSLEATHFAFWGRVSHLAWNSPTRLGWLAGKFHRSVTFNLLSADITSKHRYAWLFLWVF